MEEKTFRSLHVLRRLGHDVSRKEEEREEERKKQDDEPIDTVFAEDLTRGISDPK